jgi:trk system potassium uptake protein TrkH
MWFLYVGLTLLLIAILTLFGWLGIDDRMSLYQAAAHAFATLPTGGFGVDPRSVEPFAAATQWTIALFMALAGANFALIYRGLVRREGRAVRRDQELRLYLAILLVASIVVATQLIHQGVATGEAAARHAFFQVASLMTTTGFATVDFADWDVTLPLAAIVLIGVMFVGGCAGSTAGSIKVVRHLLLAKMLRREIDQTVHPSLVAPVRINGSAIDERTVRAIAAFILLYVGLFVLGTAILVADATRVGIDLSIMDAIAVAATTLGNVGPGLGFAGPMGSFAPFSDVSTVTMIALMWLGRLELIPIIVLATKNYWRA